MQPTERTAALWGLSSKIDSRIWVNFTRNGLRLGSRHQEPPHTDVSRNLATVVVFLLLSHSWTTDNVRGVLPGHFMLPSAEQLFKDADFIFQQDLAPAHTAKSTKSWLNDHGVGVLDWPANLPDLNPIENLWSIVKRKMRKKRPKNARNLGFHTTSAVPQTDHLHATPNWGSN